MLGEILVEIAKGVAISIGIEIVKEIFE